MCYHVKKETKYNNKNKIVNILCGIITITTIITSLSPYYSRDNINNKGQDILDDFLSQEIELDKEYYKEEVNNNIIAISEESPIVEETQVNNTHYELKNEDKIAIILSMHNISEFELYQIVSTVAHEAGENNYSECYDVITTLFNRTLSKKWCWSCKQFGGTDGTNIINQLKLSGQFAGFLPNQAGYDKDNYINTAAYQATIDFLYSLERSHNYLCFNAPWYELCPASAIQLNPDTKGNKYFDLLEADDLNEKANELGVNLAMSR